MLHKIKVKSKTPVPYQFGGFTFKENGIIFNFQ